MEQPPMESQFQHVKKYAYLKAVKFAFTQNTQNLHKIIRNSYVYYPQLFKVCYRISSIVSSFHSLVCRNKFAHYLCVINIVKILF